MLIENQLVDMLLPWLEVPVSWSSKKQATIALSTAEAKYIATTHVAKQVLWH